ncbi:DVU0524 family FlgM-associated protein [Oceanidesulfovibrio marinus]|uniref:Uncharacterized protein n=1 Tax=Oceanidesulfovibrio marinus TaxID=370038 RepID=A0A6P1ZHU5_9BACT|nr:DVU0524 family FlgM-associated protein [Oceanidesulfovibrio marinus]QJT10619.1 hypothetical protein E8L03_17605 [Oceanidesulfovibrio marinus]TVM34151.1 hypothetical protein DQK91_09635 [Oceanidesulfovibrio marinus]
MTMQSFYMRNMLRGYDKQLVTARRLARYRRALGAGSVEEPIPPEVKRRHLVERIAREIVENLIMSGTDNPVVNEIKERLNNEFGNQLTFAFPPSEQDLQIFKETKGGPMEVSPEEKIRILNRLWQVTLDKVDDTML